MKAWTLPRRGSVTTIVMTSIPSLCCGMCKRCIRTIVACLALYIAHVRSSGSKLNPARRHKKMAGNAAITANEKIDHSGWATLTGRTMFRSVREMALWL